MHRFDRFEQVARWEETDVLSAVELARAAQDRRFSKLAAPPAIAGGLEPEPEPEPEQEPEVEVEPSFGSSLPIAVPVGPAIGLPSPSFEGNEREEDPSHGYVGMSSGGPAYVQTLESGEIGANELEQFRLRFGAAVVETKAQADAWDRATRGGGQEEEEEGGSEGNSGSFPGDPPDMPSRPTAARWTDDGEDDGGAGKPCRKRATWIGLGAGDDDDDGSDGDSARDQSPDTWTP